MVSMPSTGDEDVARHLATAIVGDRSESALESLQSLAVKRPDLKTAMSEALLDDFVLHALSAQHIPWLAGSFPEVLATVRDRPGISSELLTAIDEESSGVMF
jgi:hypothetical protein